MCVDPNAAPDRTPAKEDKVAVRVKDKATVEETIFFYEPPTLEQKMMMPHAAAIFWVTLASAVAVGFAIGFCMGVFVPR